MRPSLSAIGIPRMCTPATAVPVVDSMARPLMVRATGVGLGAGVGGGVALGAGVGLDPGIVDGAMVAAGSRVRWSVAAGEQAIATTLSPSRSALPCMLEPY